MPRAFLEDRAVIALSGVEARPFLQGLITNDIENLSPRNSLYAALLTPQGKILFDFLIFARDETLLIDCAKSNRDALARRLSMYRLRAKVDITTPDDLLVSVAWGEPHPDLPQDPRLPDLGQRGIADKGGNDVATFATQAYLEHRLGLGIPESADFGSDKIFALDADLEELHGVAFEKGCYVGQELTARMKHRGTARKRLLPIEARDTPLPTEGAELLAAGRSIGDITSRYEKLGFGLIRLDRLEEAGDRPIEVNGVPIVVRRPRWLGLQGRA